MILTYLKNRYGKIYNLTMGEEKELQETIILDHDIDDLNRMLKRVEGSINIAKDSQTLNVQPFSFFMVLITAFSSATVGLVAASITMFNSFIGKYLDDKEIKKDEILNMMNSINFSPIFQSVAKSIAVPFIIVFFTWFLFYWRSTAKIDKRYNVYVLLKECIEYYDKVKNQME